MQRFYFLRTSHRLSAINLHVWCLHFLAFAHAHDVDWRMKMRESWSYRVGGKSKTNFEAQRSPK